MLIEILLTAAAVLLLIPTLTIFVQVVFAYFQGSGEIVFPDAKIKIAVLVPAHDEAKGIAATLNSILPQLEPGDRLIVVADNCTDNTAEIASAIGVEVIERYNLDNRGKGFALDFGIRFLAQNPPDVVVIIDADCTIQDNILRQIATYSIHRCKPIQCLYLMLPPNGAGLDVRVAEFAWVIKNLVRPLGYARLGLPCQLMGTGMAFPWEIISSANLANGNIVEDMKLGIDLCKAGKPPLFYVDALVMSYFPSTSESRSAQRTRWKHGHLGMILSQAPQLFMQGIIKSNKNLLAMALDLCVPPLALLVVLQSLFFMIGTLVYVMGISYLPLLISLASTVILASSIWLAWLGWGRHTISLFTFLFIPFYAFSKIPCYLGFLFNRQKKWVRTDRQ